MQSRFINAHEGGGNKVSIVTAEEGAVCVCVRVRVRVCVCQAGDREEESPKTLFPKSFFFFYNDELLISSHC